MKIFGKSSFYEKSMLCKSWTLTFVLEKLTWFTESVDKMLLMFKSGSLTRDSYLKLFFNGTLDGGGGYNRVFFVDGR